MRIASVVVIVAVIVPQVAHTAGIAIEVVGTPNPWQVWIAPQTSVSAKVWYRGEFPITGVEFRLGGIPDGWIVSASANPAASVVIGSPVDATGVNIAFSTCQDEIVHGPIDYVGVWLFDLTIMATTQEFDVGIYAYARNPPTNPAFNCPLAVHCLDADYALECVGGAGLCINSPSACGVSVEPSTWSSIKGLYR